MLTDPAATNDTTRKIIGCGVNVHREIGPGVFESVYRECMEYELRQQRLSFDKERLVVLVYKGHRLGTKFYVDFVVENRVVLELKAVEQLGEIHKRQVLTHLRLTGLPVGLLMNFNVAILTNGGVKRIVNPECKQRGNASATASEPYD